MPQAVPSHRLAVRSAGGRCCRRAPTRRRAESPAPARVIVKYKADSPLLRRQALSADEQRTVAAQTLGQRVGMAAAGRRPRRGSRAGAVRQRDDVAAAGVAAVGRERRRIRGAGPAPPPLRRAERSAVPRRPGRCRRRRRAGGRPVVPARPVRRGAVVDRRRNRVEIHDRQPGHRRGGARHGRALRPSGPAARGGRRQSAAGLRHDQRHRRRQRRRRPRCRPVRSRRLAHAGRSHAGRRPVRGLRHRGGRQLVARHADERPHRRVDEQRHRHGQRGAQCARAAGAGAGQVRRLRFGHHRRDALGSGPPRGRRAGQSQSRAGAEPQPGRRWRMRRGVSRCGRRDQRRRGRGGGRGRQQRRACGEHAGELPRRHGRGGTAPRRHQGRLLRSRAGDRHQRAGGQLCRHRAERSLPVSDSHDLQRRAHVPGAPMRPAARSIPTASTPRWARASRRRWWPGRRH